MIFVVLILVIILCLVSIKRYRILFNPFILSIQVPFLFLLLPQCILIIAFHGEDSFLSDTVILVYTFSIFIGCYIKPPKLRIPKFKNLKTIIKVLIILCVGLTLPLLPILLKYGISFRGLRQFYEYVVFSSFSSIYAIVKILLSCLIAIYFIKERRISLKIIVLAFILVFSGSKMAIFSSFLLLGTLWEQYRKMNYKLLSISALLLCIAMVFYHATQNTAKNVDAVQGAMSYFDVYRQQTMALEMLTEDKIPYFYGKIYVSSYYTVIPRLIWPDKPKDFGFALLNYKIYPAYSADGYMPSFGLGYVFADFGYFSLILAGLLAGFFKNLWYREFLYNKKNIPSFLIYALSLDIVMYVIFFIAYAISSLRSKRLLS